MEWMYLGRFLLIITALKKCSSVDEMSKVLTYFARTDDKGLYIDALDNYTWFKIRIRPSRNKQTTTTLNVQPQIVRSGKNVTVVWSGVQNAKAEDFIALYCPETSTNNDYLDYFNVEVSPTYKQGTGEHSVQLTNLRTNCEFRYFRNISEQHQELLNASNIVMFEGGPEMPLQIHLSLTGDPTQMRVMWVSGTDQRPVVKFGRNTTIDLIAEGKSQTYQKSDFCFVNGKFIDPGFIHDVLLRNLQPSAIYYYSCGVPGHMSDILHFKTAPLVGSEASFKFIAYGDMGVVSEAHHTAKNVLSDIGNGCEFILHLGDISYSRGFGYIWDQWHALIQPLSSIVPYMVGVGNHEQSHNDVSSNDLSGVTGNGFHPWWGSYDEDSNGECGVPMYYRFHMPDNGNHFWWYSYNYGMVHFIMISTEHEMGKGSKQYTWLENDLKNVDRSKTPWIILGGHRPMYTSEIYPEDYAIALAMQVFLEDLFYLYKVDLALWAHHHSYERTCAVYNNTCSKEGTVHIVIGTAGYHDDTPLRSLNAWSLILRQKDPYGYGRITVANRSALLWEYVVNSQNKVVDHMWLTKG